MQCYLATFQTTAIRAEKADEILKLAAHRRVAIVSLAPQLGQEIISPKIEIVDGVPAVITPGEFTPTIWPLEITIDDNEGVDWPEGVTVTPIETTLSTISDSVNIQPIPNIISDRQFAFGLYKIGIITYQEHLNWIKAGELPAQIGGFVQSMPLAQRELAESILSGGTEFRRQHPLVTVFGQQMGMSDIDLDEFWRFCAGF